MPIEPLHTVRCLKSSPFRSVWLVVPPHAPPHVVKSWALTPGLVVKLLVGRAQPQRQVRGSGRARRAGLRTPRILRGLRIRKASGRPMIELELEFIPAPTAFAIAQDFSTTDGIDPKAIGEIAHMLGSLVRTRLFHRDLKLSNLLVCTDDDGVHVWMLDTADVRAMRRPVGQTARMLDRLAVQLRARGIELPARYWHPVIRAALRSFSSPDRRAILQRLRSHLQRQCAQYRTPPAADPR